MINIFRKFRFNLTVLKAADDRGLDDLSPAWVILSSARDRGSEVRCEGHSASQTWSSIKIQSNQSVCLPSLATPPPQNLPSPAARANTMMSRYLLRARIACLSYAHHTTCHLVSVRVVGYLQYIYVCCMMWWVVVNDMPNENIVILRQRDWW